MFKLFISTILLFIFMKNLNAAALECEVDNYSIQNSSVISINIVNFKVEPLVSLDEIPPFVSIKVNEYFTDWALSSQQSGKLLKMKIDPNLYFYLKLSGNGYMDGFYIIKSGNLITKLDTYCSFNILSNYQSNFIKFKEGGL